MTHPIAHPERFNSITDTIDTNTINHANQPDQETLFLTAFYAVVLT